MLPERTAFAGMGAPHKQAQHTQEPLTTQALIVQQGPVCAGQRTHGRYPAQE